MESNKGNITPDGKTPAEHPRSIYDRAARDGAWIGLWFVVMFLLSVAAMKIALLNIIVITMGLLVPFIAYRLLRRTYTDSYGLVSFSALWMQGILTFACGSILLGTAAFIFMRWVYPDFIADTIRMGIEFYRNEPSAAGAELATDFQKMLDMRMLPQPMTLAMAWMWLGLFSGSVLSMFLAAITRIAKVPVKK